MTYEQVVERLTKTEFFSAFAGLYRMRAMLRYFDNPQDAIPCVHVAGTNGKGSVCSMLASILMQSGYRVGLFTSPYLLDIRERICVNGEWISEDAMARIGTKVFDYVAKSYAPANQFELLTVIAQLYFREQKCDIVILETGLGGTFDPTNAVSTPICSVITNIGLDHCAVLGDTIAKIAAAKAGIIKPGRDVCVYPVTREAEEVITAYALNAAAPIHMTERDAVTELPAVTGMEHFSYKGTEVLLPLRGKHQQYNAATVLEAIRVINENGFYVSDEDIQNGLRTVTWRARLEVINKKPLVYLDGGHNPQCLAAVSEFFRSEEFAGKKLTVICSMIRDKDVRGMLSILSGLSDRLYFYRFEHKRALTNEEIITLCKDFSMTRITDLTQAIDTLLSDAKSNEVFLITGSLYLVSEVRKAMRAYRERKSLTASKEVSE